MDKKCDCKMMLAGVAILCLLIGGLAGYWYATQQAQNSDYLQKQTVRNCVSGCGGSLDCIYNCLYGSTSPGGAATAAGR